MKIWIKWKRNRVYSEFNVIEVEKSNSIEKTSRITAVLLYILSLLAMRCKKGIFARYISHPKIMRYLVGDEEKLSSAIRISATDLRKNSFISFHTNYAQFSKNILSFTSHW